MTFTRIQEHQLIVLQPQGCLDLQNGETLRKQIAGLEPQLHCIWVLDLGQVDFMDSSGLAAVVKGLSTARSNGCRLVICNLQPPVQMLFELTRMDLVVEIFENYHAVLLTRATNS